MLPSHAVGARVRVSDRPSQKLDVDQRCESCVRSDGVKSPQPVHWLLCQRQDRYFEILSADELEPIHDVCVRARHLASSMLQLTPLAAPSSCLCPRSRAAQPCTPFSGSWELNHIDPRERTTGELLKSAAHLEVAEVDGHEAEPIDELRYFLLCRRVVSREK
jgi:hypothetical protein